MGLTGNTIGRHILQGHSSECKVDVVEGKKIEEERGTQRSWVFGSNGGEKLRNGVMGRQTQKGKANHKRQFTLLQINE